VPIDDDLAQLLKEIRGRNQLRSEFVFCDKQGRPFKDLKTSFGAACKKAGIEDFRFHDLRHTFASHFVMRGGSLKDLQEILGHRSMVMTLRYAHLSQEHKKRAINLMNGLTAPGSGNCHKTVTSSHVSKTATT
jgi:integrase